MTHAMITPSIQAYTLKQFCQAYQISRSKAYQYMKAGQLEFVLVGNRRRIPVEAAERWFESLPKKEAKHYG